MGLSGPKRHTKISSDPNNTSWSKSTDSFGHKILSAQGWKPGQLLGAENAAHAEHFTAANASHIRVMLREDNLGLGAQLGKGNAETFGLSTLSGIFGRLNGKSDADVEKMQSAQRDVELRSYQTRKFGLMTFVRGGLLVGDKMEDDSTLPAQPQQRMAEDIKDSDSAAFSKKRKRDGAPADKDIRKKKKTTRKDANTLPIEPTEQADAEPNSTVTPVTTVLNDEDALRAMKKAEKAERRARKEDRRKRKEERAIRREERHKKRLNTDKPPDGNKPPTMPAAAAAAISGSRQAFRQRFMQQKRLASMDAKALNEILMLKTAVA